MEYVYAAMLLHKAGKDVTEDSVEKILKAAGVDADSSRIKALVAALDGVDIEEAVASAAVAPAAAAAPAASSGGDDSGAPAQDAEADEKEEKADDDEDEKSEEEAAEGLGALFG